MSCVNWASRSFIVNRRNGLDPLLIGRLARLIRKQKVDMVHTHNVAPWLYAGLAARLAGAKVCHTEHSNLFSGQRALKRAERLLGRLSKAVICDGDDVRRQLVEEQKLSPRNVVTIHNGVDTALYGQSYDRLSERSEGRRKLGLSEDTPVLATVARLEPVKDQGTLLRAFEKVGATLPDARLVLVGDGSERAGAGGAGAPAGAGRAGASSSAAGRTWPTCCRCSTPSP